MLNLQASQSTHFNFWFATATIIAISASAVILAWSTASAAVLFVTLLIGIPFAILYLQNPHLGLVLAVLAIVPGQLVRLSLGTDVRGGAAIILTDVMIGLLVLVWVMKKLTVDRKFEKTVLSVPIIVFTLLALVSLVQGYWILDRVGTIELKEMVVAFLYWVRWVMYASVFFITVDVVKTEKQTNRYLTLLFWVGVLVSIGGFIQLIVMPDFTQ